VPFENVKAFKVLDYPYKRKSSFNSFHLRGQIINSFTRTITGNAKQPFGRFFRHDEEIHKVNGEVEEGRLQEREVQRFAQRLIEYHLI
jgi:hypothetical protein